MSSSNSTGDGCGCGFGCADKEPDMSLIIEAIKCGNVELVSEMSTHPKFMILLNNPFKDPSLWQIMMPKFQYKLSEIAIEEEWYLIHLAILVGNLEIINLLLTLGANPNVKTRNYILSPIHCIDSKSSKTFDILNILIDHSVDLDSRDFSGLSLLHYMIHNQSDYLGKFMELLTNHNIDIHLYDNDVNHEVGQYVEHLGICFYQTSLPIHAIKANNIHAIELLLAHGINLNIPANKMLLHMAASSSNNNGIGNGNYCSRNDNSNDNSNDDCVGNRSIFKLLIKNGFDIHSRDIYDRTCLHYAAVFHNIEVMNLCVGAGISVNCVTNCGSTPLIGVCKFYLQTTNSISGTDIIKFLIESGADINHKNNYGDTALSIGLASNNSEVVNLLLELGADISSIHFHVLDKCLGKILESSNVDIKLVQLILSNGANVDGNVDANVDGNVDANIDANCRKIPLCLATRNNNLDIVKLLLSDGASPDNKDESGLTALLIASNHGYTDIVEVLLSSVVNMYMMNLDGKNSFHLAVMCGYIDIIRLLQQKDPDIIYSEDIHSQTALHIAAYSGHKDIVVLLIELGADINSKDNLGWTPLITTLIHGHNDVEGIVTLLLDFGADINVQSNTKKNVLQYALTYGKHLLVKLFLDKNFDVNTKDDNNMTVLHIACESGHCDVALLLLEFGADINAQDTKGWSVLHYACYNRHFDIISFLLSKGFDSHRAYRNLIQVNEDGQVIGSARQVMVFNNNNNNELYTTYINLLSNWTTTMLMLVLEELKVYNIIDLTSYNDLFQYIGEEEHYCEQIV